MYNLKQLKEVIELFERKIKEDKHSSLEDFAILIDNGEYVVPLSGVGLAEPFEEMTLAFPDLKGIAILMTQNAAERNVESQPVAEAEVLDNTFAPLATGGKLLN